MTPRSGNTGRILVVDDQRNMRTTTALLLRAEGYDVEEAANAPEAMAILGMGPLDLVLTDLRMEPVSGLELLRHVLQAAPKTQVMVMTAFGSIESAVEAMRIGAYDYVTKPFKEGELVHRVGRAMERSKLLSAVDLFAGEFNRQHGFLALIGRSAPVRELTARILRVAPSDATVLIQGESGTGKELVARAIHAHSARRDRPFVPVNCAAITESLLESELFGHAKGAFTGALKARRGLFEEADGGTLFIDEVTETTPAFQSKLLRVLQDGEMRRVGESTPIRVNVRIVTATNRDIEVELREKRFREDLFYRLKVVSIEVPPLRERLEDIPLLTEHFLGRWNKRSNRQKRISAAACAHLANYSFPGNVRELENLVEQAAALSEDEVLGPDDFPLKPKGEPEGRQYAGLTHAAAGSITLADAVAQAERRAIQGSVERHEGNLATVAHELGVSSTTLWRKMKRLGIYNDIVNS